MENETYEKYSFEKVYFKKVLNIWKRIEIV